MKRMNEVSEKEEYFKYRTGFHLYLVNKWSNKILKKEYPEIIKIDFENERDDHDKMKWIEPEYTPYLEITWNYRCKRLGILCKTSEEVINQTHEATFHHIKNHKHHPEYWDDTVTINSLNKDDRDRPSMGKIVDGTMMPLTYVAAMIADWFAMSEELGTHPKDWADRNINIRWKFTELQKDFIYKIIRDVWCQK